MSFIALLKDFISPQGSLPLTEEKHPLPQRSPSYKLYLREHTIPMPSHFVSKDTLEFLHAFSNAFEALVSLVTAHTWSLHLPNRSPRTVHTCASSTHYCGISPSQPFEETDMTQYYLGTTPSPAAFLSLSPVAQVPTPLTAASYESCLSDLSPSHTSRHILLSPKPFKSPPRASTSSSAAGGISANGSRDSPTQRSAQRADEHMSSPRAHSVQAQSASNATEQRTGCELLLEGISPLRGMQSLKTGQQQGALLQQSPARLHMPPDLGQQRQLEQHPSSLQSVVPGDLHQQTLLQHSDSQRMPLAMEPEERASQNIHTSTGSRMSHSYEQGASPSRPPRLQKPPAEKFGEVVNQASIEKPASSGHVEPSEQAKQQTIPKEEHLHGRTGSQNSDLKVKHFSSTPQSEHGGASKVDEVDETDSAPPFYRPRFNHTMDLASVDSSPPFYRPRRDPMVFQFSSSACSDSLVCSEVDGDFNDSELSRCLDTIEDSHLTSFCNDRAIVHGAVYPAGADPSTKLKDWARLSAEAIGASLEVDEQWAALSPEAMAASMSADGGQSALAGDPLEGNDCAQERADRDDLHQSNLSSQALGELARSTPPDSEQEEVCAEIAARMPEGLAGTDINVLNRGDCYYLTGQIEPTPSDSILVAPGDPIPEGYEPVRYHYTVLPIEGGGRVGNVMASFRSENPAVFGSDADVVGGDFVLRDDGTLQVWNLAKTNWTTASGGPLPLTADGRVEPQVTLRQRHRELTSGELAQLATHQHSQ